MADRGTSGEELSPVSRQPLTIELEDGDRVTAQVYAGESEPPSSSLVLAHGAGAGQFSPFIVRFARAFARRGIRVITFDFPYMQHGKRAPDKAPKLESTYRAVLGQTTPADAAGKLFIGGKSLGGRIASHLAAAVDELAQRLSGLVCLGYPLHAPGQTRRRDAHLPAIRAPVLIVQGERDAFGTPEEIRTAMKAMSAKVRLFVVEGGDHSLSVPKSGKRTQEEVYRLVEEEISGWMASAPPPGPPR
jgi:uncharacterized protein